MYHPTNNINFADWDNLNKKICIKYFGNKWYTYAYGYFFYQNKMLQNLLWKVAIALTWKVSYIQNC